MNAHETHSPLETAHRSSESAGPAPEPEALDVVQPLPGISIRRRTLRLARKIAVGVAGGALLIAGVALIFLPGPAIIVIPLALALLATEFPWAARFLRYLKDRAKRLVEGARRALAWRSHT